MAAACPECGRPAELPRITPELLYFECHEGGAPERALTLPNGDFVFAHRGQICAMAPGDWQRFERLRETL